MNTERQVEGRGSSYQSGSMQGQPFLLEVRGSAWKRLNKNTSCGKGLSALGYWWVPGLQAGDATLSKGTLQCCSSWLLLILGILFRRIPPNCECKHCKNELAFQFSLRHCTSSCGVWLLALGPCLPCGHSPSFFFSLCRGTTQSMLSWILLAHLGCVSPSPLTSAKVFWNSCLVSSGIHQ